MSRDASDLWYEIHGEGTPIVFIHGWGVDHRDESLEYEPILAERPGWSRLYLDLPGMGRTPPAASLDRLDRYLDVLLEFLDRVLKGKRFVLAGTSAGAYLARGVLLQRSRLIDGLLLKVPVIEPGIAKRQTPPFKPLVSDPQLMTGLNPAERAALGDVLVQNPSYVDALRMKIRERFQPAQQIAENARLEEIRQDARRYSLSFDVDAPGRPFDAPTLIVCGRQDTVVGYRDAWRIVENFPRATFAILDRADHGLLVDRPQLFHALVNDWLDRIEEMRRQ
jgi:pimeloyl-ACP methyl ester carboxylesterase